TTTSSTITSIQNTNAVLRIGAWVQSSLNSFMGSIDDIRIYNRALSDQEILQLYSPAITQGLVAYYPFDGNANDYSTNGNNGTPFGGISWDTDRFGNASSACNFDGTNSYIEIPNSESIQINTNKLTFTLWFNCTGTPQGPAAFFSKTDNPDIPQYTFHLNPFSIIRFGITDTSNVLRYISHPYPFSYNQWYFLAATWDGTTVKIFVNDSLVTTQPFVYIMKSDTNPLEIGKDTGGLTDWYQGKLDDVRIYNRALSQTEIINLVTDVESENSLVTLDKFVLSQNYPNPFNPSTTINFSVPGASNVNITVYDINGQVVSNLLSEFKNSGNYSLNWDGKNDSGSKVSSGTYFYQVQIGNLVQTKKMILLK
ncbi:MAG: LamG-like jellyroll fold domain-containing protein, partial [Ignavibacteriaceae bacterium]|nr:LamG-like jellyroll fold domain-containing protein [Ignavibacteriaceae bacterium]